MMIRATIAGLTVALVAGCLFLFVPVDASRSARAAGAADSVVAPIPPQPPVTESAAKIEAANLWGVVTAQGAGDTQKITGKILGAVHTRDTQYVLLQVGQQQPVELKLGDALPVQIEPFAGGKIVDIRADRITVLKNGERYVISIIN